MTAKTRLLLLAPNWLGDAVMTLPALDALLNHELNYAITIASRRHIMPVYAAKQELAGNTQFSLLQLDKKSGLRRIVQGWKSARSLAGQFDIVLTFAGSFAAALWCYATKTPTRVGVSSDKRSFLLTKTIRPSETIHQIDDYNRLAQLIGADKFPVYPSLDASGIVSNPKRIAALPEDIQNVVRNSRQLAVILPCSAHGSTKDWPAERYAEVAKHLSDWDIIVSGLPRDAAVCDQIAAAAENGYSDPGLTDVSGLITMLARANLVIGGDSGGTHLSAALSCPTISVFGITSTQRFAQHGEKVIVLGGGQAIKIRLKDAKVASESRAILQSVTVSQVLESIEKLLPGCVTKKYGLTKPNNNPKQPWHTQQGDTAISNKEFETQ